MSLEDLSFEARDELAALARQLAENPNTRKDFLRMTKKVKPDLPIPELEIEEYTNRSVEAANKRVEELESKWRERDTLDELKSRRQKLIKKGLAADDAEIEKIEKVMLDKGITDHETAAEYWKWMEQSAVPTSGSVGYNPSPLKAWDLSKFMKNPIQAGRDAAHSALSELRKNPKPIGL